MIEFFETVRLSGWRHVKAAAERLHELGELSGDELRELLRIDDTAPAYSSRAAAGSARRKPSSLPDAEACGTRTATAAQFEMAGGAAFNKRSVAGG